MVNWPGRCHNKGVPQIAPVVGCGGCEESEHCWAWRQVARQAGRLMRIDVPEIKDNYGVYQEADLRIIPDPCSPYVEAREVLTFDENGKATGWNGQSRLIPSRLAKMAKCRGVWALCLHGDLFAPGAKDEWIDAVLKAAILNNKATWIVLTKQAKRMRDFLQDANPGGLGAFWFGVSVSTQADADERIPLLLDTSTAHRWLSVEPLLSSITLKPEWLYGAEEHGIARTVGGCVKWTPPIEACIVGAESGKGRRSCAPEWMARVVRQCQDAGVAVWIKQVDVAGKLEHYQPPESWPWKNKTEKGSDDE